VWMDASDSGIIIWGGGLVGVLFGMLVGGETHVGAGQMVSSGGG
jgi:hypothetical protein